MAMICAPAKRFTVTVAEASRLRRSRPVTFSVCSPGTSARLAALNVPVVSLVATPGAGVWTALARLVLTIVDGSRFVQVPLMVLFAEPVEVPESGELMVMVGALLRRKTRREAVATRPAPFLPCAARTLRPSARWTFGAVKGRATLMSLPAMAAGEPLTSAVTTPPPPRARGRGGGVGVVGCW